LHKIHQRDIEREALELERRRRKELERRLAQEIAKHNDVIEQAIKLREKEKLQVGYQVSSALLTPGQVMLQVKDFKCLFVLLRHSSVLAVSLSIELI